jgi:hypothetical protein
MDGTDARRRGRDPEALGSQLAFPPEASGWNKQIGPEWLGSIYFFKASIEPETTLNNKKLENIDENSVFSVSLWQNA